MGIVCYSYLHCTAVLLIIFSLSLTWSFIPQHNFDNFSRLAQIQPGDVVMDPMCGGGSIPIEAALTYPKAFHLGGDSHDKAVQR